MPPHLGIGLITYDRCDVLRETIAEVRRLTQHTRTSLVVADDGSTDGTIAMLDSLGVGRVSGANAGVAWNKNRALFLLADVLACDVVVLLEDDTRPTRLGWEAPWMEVATRIGHVNVAMEHLREHFLYGSGTPADPIGSSVITAQCTAFSREALRWGGYLDSRFRGFGHEHVEHSIRLARLGYGGGEEEIAGERRTVFKLIWGELDFAAVPSFTDAAQVDQNLTLAQTLTGEQRYRAPWIDDAEARRFRAEISAALARHRGGFPLHTGGLAISPPDGTPPWEIAGTRLPR